MLQHISIVLLLCAWRKKIAIDYLNNIEWSLHVYQFTSIECDFFLFVALVFIIFLLVLRFPSSLVFVFTKILWKVSNVAKRGLQWAKKKSTQQSTSYKKKKKRKKYIGKRCDLLALFLVFINRVRNKTKTASMTQLTILPTNNQDCEPPFNSVYHPKSYTAHIVSWVFNFILRAGLCESILSDFFYLKRKKVKRISCCRFSQCLLWFWRK